MNYFQLAELECRVGDAESRAESAELQVRFPIFTFFVHSGEILYFHFHFFLLVRSGEISYFHVHFFV